jgi:hypothetical protein
MADARQALVHLTNRRHERAHSLRPPLPNSSPLPSSAPPGPPLEARPPGPA